MVSPYPGLGDPAFGESFGSPIEEIQPLMNKIPTPGEYA